MKKNYNENLVAGAAIRDDKGRRISKLFESSHPKMTVGYAMNLIIPNAPTEQEFNFRQAGGGVIEDGLAVIDKVKGNSVVWNQLVKPTEVIGVSGVTMTLNVDGSITLNGTATETKEATIFFKAISLIESQKVVMYRDNLVGKNAIQVPSDKTGDFMVNVQQEGRIFTIEGTGGESMVWIKINNGDAFSNTKIHIGLSNLTQMFGAGNEPSTVEEFLSRKPKVADEYAYNEGTIVNNKVEKVVTTGKNLWDEEWEQGYINDQGQKITVTNQICSKNFIPAFPSANYHCAIPFSISGTGGAFIAFYDANNNFISRSSVAYTTTGYDFTTPSNCHFMKLSSSSYYIGGGTYNHDICINLSDPTINGQYFPYEKHELDLSWLKDIKDSEGVKLFEDGMKSAVTIFDEAAKGRAIKRIGVKVFDGTEAWRTISNCFYATNVGLNKAKSENPMGRANLYPWTDKGNNIYSGVLDKHFTLNNSYFGSIYDSIGIRDSAYSSVDAWKQHLAELYAAGTPLVVYYELAEPIEVEYDEKNLTYPVVAGGTEEAIASEPTAAFRADIGYGIDAVKTILDLKARVEALEGK